LWHKGVVPAIMIGMTTLGLLFAVYQYRSNTDKQRQIDRLQAEVQTVKAQQQATEQGQRERVQRAEEDTQRLRVELCKGLFPAEMNARNSPEDAQRAVHIKTYHACQIALLQLLDGRRLGEDKAKEMWEKARKQAEQESKDGKVDYTP
jgi:hypothetical protein